MSDNVNNPKHYTSHPSGVECIQITRHMSFNLGNVIKYLWRADEKGAAMEDLKKARWYLDDEIKRREAADASAWPASVHTPTQPDADGWIEWRGGECPVSPYETVQVRLRDADRQKYVKCEAAAGMMGWHHQQAGTDIIAYRIIKEGEE